MSGDLDLEQRYRRVLRLLPRYYRDKWEEDMVAAFLDGWMTGDPDEDSVTMEYDRPTREEIVSVIGLAARLHLGGVGAPRRYFAWGQAVRNAVLGVMLAHAVWGLGQLALFARSRHLIGWLPPPPGGFWPMLGYATGYAWIVVFVALLLADYRTARVARRPRRRRDRRQRAASAAGGHPGVAVRDWAYMVVIDVAPVLAMAAFHRDAPPVRRWPWLLALPAWYLLVSVPVLWAELSGHAAWVPDVAGRCCLLLSLVCLFHAAQGLVRPRRHRRVVADPAAACRRHRAVPDHLAADLRARPPPDHGRPGGTAHPGGRGRARRPGCGPLADRHARAARLPGAAMKPAIAHRGGRVMRGPGRFPTRVSMALAGLVLTVAGCSQALPLGPAPAPSRCRAAWRRPSSCSPG